MTTRRAPKPKTVKAAINGGSQSARDARLVSELGSRALTRSTLDAVMEDALELVRSRLDTELVKILELVPSGEGFLLVAGIGWQPGYVGQVVVPLIPESQAGYTMIHDRTVIVADLKEEKRFRGMPLLHEHGVVSGISTVLHGQERVHGIMTAHSRQLRAFTADDLAFFESVASVVAAAMDRRDKEKELAEAHQRLSLALEAGRFGAWDWNPYTGEVVWSDELYRTYGLEPGQFGGTVDDYIALVHPADRDSVGTQIEEALGTGRLEMQYRIMRADGDVRWLMSRGMVVYNERGEPVRMTGICSDETDRRLDEMRLAAQYAVTRALVEAPSLSDGLRGALSAICENLDWPVGQMWLPDPESGELSLFDRCDSLHTDDSSFAEVSRARTFTGGSLLPGRVLETGTPFWIEDIASEEQFSRKEQARELGLSSGMGFPIIRGREVIGVMEFFAPERRKKKAELLDAVMAIGSQIGEYVERHHIQAEQERLMVRLKIAETRYRSVFEQATDAILVANNTGHLVEGNQAALDLLGYSPDELPRLAISDIVVGWFPGQFEELVINGEWSGSLEFRRKTGMTVPVELSATKIALASGEVFVAVVRDITERARHELQREFLAQASAILVSSLDYEETLANLARHCVPFLGDWCTIDIIEGEALQRVAVVHSDPARVAWAEDFRRRYPPDLRADSVPNRWLKSGQTIRLSAVTESIVKAISTDEEMADMLFELGIKSAMAVPIIARGKTIGLLTLATSESGRTYSEAEQTLAEDLCRRAGLAIDNGRLYRESRETEEKLRVANAAKDEFLGLVSHEMRTPMTTIHGGARLLRRSWEKIDAESREAVLGDIEQQSERLQRIVEDLLALARVELGEEVQREPVLVQRTVDHAVSLYQKSRPNRVIQRHEDPEIPPINGSPVYLEQVLLNLLSNADKYSPADEHIEVYSEMREGHVVISVLDRGPGIPLEDTQRIFERFYRSAATANRAGGAGIGLTVCKRLIEALDGTIWAELREGGGLIISFSLPAYDEGAP